MIDGAVVPASTRLGRLLRLPLRLVPKGAVVRVLSGRLRGAKWIVGSSPHGCWLGTYERQAQDLAWRLASSSRVVYDIGANVGFFTMIFARASPNTTSVIAVEPVPENVELLQRHLELNRIQQVNILNIALGARDRTGRFRGGASRSQGRLDESGELEVEERTLDTLALRYGAQPPDLIKIDAEGEELAILEGARRVLEGYSPLVWVETHGWTVHEACKRLLSELGYELEDEIETGVSGHGSFVAVPSSGRKKAT